MAGRVVGLIELFGMGAAVLAALAVGLSAGLMHYARCVHPPGGATALAAVLGGDAVRALVALGYADSDAERAVRGVIEHAKDAAPAEIARSAASSQNPRVKIGRPGIGSGGGGGRLQRPQVVQPQVHKPAGANARQVGAGALTIEQIRQLVTAARGGR